MHTHSLLVSRVLILKSAFATCLAAIMTFGVSAYASNHVASSETVSKLGPLSQIMYAQRIEHANELLGRHYSKSVVRSTELVEKIHGRLYRHTHSSLPKKHKKNYQRIAQTIIDEAHRYGFDPVFLIAVIQSESSFNPDIRGGVGEIGLMQILPSTGKWMAEIAGYKWQGEKTLLDPVQNIRIGAAYLNWLRARFDSHARLYLAAYNMGQGNVRDALSRKVWPKDYPRRVMDNYVGFYTDLQSELGGDQSTPANQLAQN